MRSKALLLLSLTWSLVSHANDVNISTVTLNGATRFFLQAGAFNFEKDAQARAKRLSERTQEKIEVKKLSDKHLYLVQVGPIDDYQAARIIKEQLSNMEKSNANTNTTTTSTPANNSTPLLNPNQTTNKPSPNAHNNQNGNGVPEQSKLWNLRNADIRAVIAEVSRVTGRNFIIDPRVQGKISIISTTAISNKELYQVFLSVLQVSGYAAIPNGDVTKIIPNIDAKTQTSDFPGDKNHPPRGDDMMVAVVPVNYVPAEQLVPVLRPLMPQWSSISAYAPSNMLILSGRANNIKSLANIIKQVDNSSSSDVDMFSLKHALAMDIANTLKDLIKTQANSGRSQISVTSDDRSNSILVNGSKTDRIRMGMLILKLDKKSSQGLNSNTKVVYLHYLRAEDLVPILAGIAQANFSGNVGTTIGKVTVPVLDSTNPASNLANAGNNSSQTTQTDTSSTQSSSSSSGGGTENTSSTSTQNEGTTKPTVQIIAEPNTNSIILNAPSSIIRILESVIKKLDIRPAQLLIEAIVAEVSQEDAVNLGIEWGTNAQTGKVASFTPGFAILNSATNIADFQAQIYALAEQQKANILSTPSVVVLDNRQAKILVGKQVSIASTTYPNNAGGTTTASPYTTFDRVNVALHLYVRPQITQGNGIQMQIDQGNDTLDPPSTTVVGNNPTFKISSIVTSVHVQSGDIIVLGGLTQDSLGDDNNALPILGNIPGVGRLFQRNNHSREKRVLMVFIKPIILRTEQEGLQVTGEKYNDARQYQLEWLRSEEAFTQSEQAAILPPLTQANLPRPFVDPPPAWLHKTK